MGYSRRGAPSGPHVVRRNLEPATVAPLRGQSQRSFWGRLFIAFFRLSAVAVGVGIAVVLYTMPVLAVAEVEVYGNRRLDRQTVLALLDVEGRNLLTLDLPAAEARLAGHPWVRQAKVRRQLPALVVATISERQPAAVWQTGGDRYLMAEDGVLLERASLDAALPTVVDMDGVSQQVGGSVPASPATLAQELVRRLPASGGETVARLEYRASQGLVAVTASGLRLVFGDGADLSYQLATYRALLAQGEWKALNVREIDLRFGVRPALRPERKDERKPAP